MGQEGEGGDLRVVWRDAEFQAVCFLLKKIPFSFKRWWKGVGWFLFQQIVCCNFSFVPDSHATIPPTSSTAPPSFLPLGWSPWTSSSPRSGGSRWSLSLKLNSLGCLIMNSKLIKLRCSRIVFVEVRSDFVLGRGVGICEFRSVHPPPLPLPSICCSPRAS